MGIGSILGAIASSGFAGGGGMDSGLSGGNNQGQGLSQLMQMLGLQGPGSDAGLARDGSQLRDPKGGYSSSDGLVNIPGLSREDALAGLRSVLDFRHIYGPKTAVPDINFGGQIFSGKADDAPYANYLNGFGGR